MQSTPIDAYMCSMKKIMLILGSAALLMCGVSCESVNAGAGVPIPFTDDGFGSPVRVSLDVEARALPPKICVGLDVAEAE